MYSFIYSIYKKYRRFFVTVNSRVTFLRKSDGAAIKITQRVATYEYGLSTSRQRQTAIKEKRRVCKGERRETYMDHVVRATAYNAMIGEPKDGTGRP
jgi:hypothetical protein